MGIVGNVRHSSVGDRELSLFTVATNLAFKDADSNVIIETTWHNVSSFQPSLEALSKGDMVHVEGRLKVNRYVASDGVERSSTDVVATLVERLDPSCRRQVEMG